MQAQIKEVLGQELRQRHGVGVMTVKIKPVHIANALMRVEHGMVGRMGDLEQLMTATAKTRSADEKLDAVRQMIERNRERWGRLGQEGDLRKSVLMTRVLPNLRTILGTDNATFGSSPEFSSFSSPTALTVTRDPSDEHAGELVHWIWGGHDDQRRLDILALLRRLTDPSRSVSDIDDLSAVLIPLSDSMTPLRNSSPFVAPADTANSSIVQSLRESAKDLCRYEQALKPNPIASLQRIVLLGSMTLFYYLATRASESGASPKRFLLLDASYQRQSTVAIASEDSVTALLGDGRRYMGFVLSQLLEQHNEKWYENAEQSLSALFVAKLSKKQLSSDYSVLHELIDELDDAGANIGSELPERLVGLMDSSSGQGLEGYLRLLGLRCGLFYPQQKNPRKCLQPMDRTLEVLVASTFDLSGEPLEYRDFLDRLYDRWQIVVGGRLEDAKLLSDAGMPVSSADLSDNSRRFLGRLEALGLAKGLADSVAVVGLMESSHAN